MSVNVGALILLYLAVSVAGFSSLRSAGAQSPPSPNVTEGPDESYSLRKLRQELLVNRQYDRVSRPVKNHQSQLKVDMRLTINEFVELDTVNSVLVTDAWFHITWRDEFLTWDPADYQQLRQIHMGPNEIWRPDIVLINTAQQDNLLNIFTDSELLVNSTGDVTWITMGLLRSKCPIWAYDYPFAIRPVNCRLTFCSLIYQSHEVNITTPGNEFFLAGPWFVNPRLQFINITGERYERYYDGYGTYSFESITIQLKRRDNSLPLLVRVPTLTSIVLTLAMFLLPIHWPVRIHLALCALLIQLLLILYIGLQLGANAIGLARPISMLRDDLSLSTFALLATLLFRRLLALAEQLPEIPRPVVLLLSGSMAKLLCFGISSRDYVCEPKRSGGRRELKNHPRRQQQQGREHVTLVDDCALEQQQDDDDEQQQHRSYSVAIDINQQPTQLTGCQFEWMQIIIFCDRILFIFYAFTMIPRLM